MHALICCQTPKAELLDQSQMHAVEMVRVVVMAFTTLLAEYPVEVLTEVLSDTKSLLKVEFQTSICCLQRIKL